ncbi:MAG: hypothetical protein ABR949_02340 [Candidatus Aquilonibacter sp.]
MSDYPRRRRLDPEPPKRGGIPIVPLMVLVILGGLLLGGLLTKFFGTGGAQAPTPAPSFTPLPGVSATFAPTFSPTPQQSISPRPSHSPSHAPTATPMPSVTLLPSTTPAPTAKAAVAQPTPHKTPGIIILTPTPAPAAPAATATAPPLVVTPTATPVLITGANSTEHAAAIVRAYIASLARGDSATAAGYLANGLPTESFINPNVSVNVADLRASRNGDGTVAVATQIVTSKGTYLASFTLRMGAYGMQITDHSATHI